jgi:hypothetical protein
LLTSFSETALVGFQVVDVVDAVVVVAVVVVFVVECFVVAVEALADVFAGFEEVDAFTGFAGAEVLVVFGPFALGPGAATSGADSIIDARAAVASAVHLALCMNVPPAEPTSNARTALPIAARQPLSSTHAADYRSRDDENIVGLGTDLPPRPTGVKF